MSQENFSTKKSNSLELNPSKSDGKEESIIEKIELEPFFVKLNDEIMEKSFIISQPRDQQKKTEPKSPIDFDNFDFDRFQLIPDDAKVYHLKIHQYKEIKHYIKGEKLGKGKFGTVREFVDRRTLKRYAGKIIKRSILKRDKHLRRQINKELAITYHFDHPNILRVYDLYMASQKIYLFMEFCYGELGELIETYRTLSKCQSKDFFGQICEGLDYLHSRGVIHRDIKPDNVLITADNQLKLADFGVCQNVDMFTLDDMVGGNDGTPLYHSPEMFDFNILKYSGSKLDIWAAAVILYQMIVGEVPFFKKGQLTEEDHDAMLNKPPEYPQSVRSDVLLLDLFNRLFEKNFRKRITIAEIRKHLWMQIKCLERSTHFRAFPNEKRKIDCYRGITVLTRIHEKLHPTPMEEMNRLVDHKEMEESRQVLPLVRGQRMLATKKMSGYKREKVSFVLTQ